MRSDLVAGSMIAVVALACAQRAEAPVPLASPETLDVVFDSPACERAEPPPSVERVVEGITAHPSRFWHVRGCFPVRLSDAPACEWACVVVQSGPCGNGGSHEVLALSARGHVVGYAGIRDSQRWYQRDFRIENTPRGPVLQVDLHAVPTTTEEHFESYRLLDGRVVCLDANCSSIQAPR
ncbi:hypothetical protein AKJ09_00675 [Labilithrix luteola]|uniref:Lipoprotein n=1 Tax=Labilithrix luteola TaxID=1391654 RepID=A0A0K1PKT3_9BACT|nr:hypothetical protein [Labilithrix luteola]AKU94011.1 hypothetical protein AKJ09_00675 [Labilithrix luteola]